MYLPHHVCGLLLECMYHHVDGFGRLDTYKQVYVVTVEATA